MDSCLYAQTNPRVRAAEIMIPVVHLFLHISTSSVGHGVYVERKFLDRSS